MIELGLMELSGVNDLMTTWFPVVFSFFPPRDFLSSPLHSRFIIGTWALEFFGVLWHLEFGRGFNTFLGIFCIFSSYGHGVYCFVFFLVAFVLQLDCVIHFGSGILIDWGL
jgi:hypothetical protein